MRIDIIDLRDFYETDLGIAVRRIVRREIRNVWPDMAGLDCLGLGYATPFLGVFRPLANRVLNFMPAAQGVMRWPADGGSVTTLVEETSLPLADASIDRILLVHALENSESVRSMMREIWRVLSPGGRLMIITPNRRGIWARIDTTPFGHGRPFSRRQLNELMRDSQFTPIRWARTLYTPPFAFDFLARSSGAWEKIGNRLWPQFSGLLMLEASKQIYAVSAERPKLRVLRPVPVAQPAIPRDSGS